MKSATEIESLYKLAHKKFAYDRETGKLFFRLRSKEEMTAPEYGRHIKLAGTEAGSPNADGYVKVYIKTSSSTYVSAHRLIWLMMTGDWPEYPFFEIDHLNGNRSDNRWPNLRKVTKSQNQRNSTGRKNNSSGVHGVNWKASKDLASGGSWVARIWNGPKHVYLGSFANIEHAKIARKAAERALGFREGN